MTFFLRSLVVLLVLYNSGCAVVDGGVELSKTVWGSSTKALEEARANAIVKAYNKPYWDVVRAAEAFCSKNYVIFKKDEIKGYFVVMGVKGNVNTTEIGIFFVDLDDKQTRIEISSLSITGKRAVAKALFHGLDIVFGLVPPDPEEIPAEDADQDGKKHD